MQNESERNKKVIEHDASGGKPNGINKWKAQLDAKRWQRQINERSTAKSRKAQKGALNDI